MVEISEFKGFFVNQEQTSSDKMEIIRHTVGALISKEKIDLSAHYYSEDSEPTIYLYQIDYPFYPSYRKALYWKQKKIKRKLRGFVALARLSDLKRHEGTNKPKEQTRIESYSANQLLPTPIMAMFKDQEKLIERIFSRAANPLNATTVYNDSDIEEYSRRIGSAPERTKHRVLRITDKRIISAIKAEMEKIPVAVIADGHHRYGALTAMGVKYAPVFFVDVEDKDLLLLSWHRIVRTSYEKIGEAMQTVLGAEDVSRYKTKWYKVEDVDSLRKATHPLKDWKLNVIRRARWDPQKEYPPGVQHITREMPFEIELAEYPPENFIAGAHGEEPGLWLRKKEKEGRTVYEKLFLFGVYLAYKHPEKGNIAKHSVLAVHGSVIEYTKRLDELISSLVGNPADDIMYKYEIGQAVDLVNRLDYKIAILIPVLKKSSVMNYSLKASTADLFPETITCFLPKPGDGVLMWKIPRD